MPSSSRLDLEPDTFAIWYRSRRYGPLVLPVLVSRLRSVWPFAVSLFLSLFFWCVLTGRTVGVHAHGRLFTGWFFLRTYTVDLHDEYRVGIGPER